MESSSNQAECDRETQILKNLIRNQIQNVKIRCKIFNIGNMDKGVKQFKKLWYEMQKQNIEKSLSQFRH